MPQKLVKVFRRNISKKIQIVGLNRGIKLDQEENENL